MISTRKQSSSRALEHAWEVIYISFSKFQSEFHNQFCPLLLKVHARYSSISQKIIKISVYKSDYCTSRAQKTQRTVKNQVLVSRIHEERKLQRTMIADFLNIGQYHQNGGR
jgi:uncharacterized protein YpbB